MHPLRCGMNQVKSRLTVYCMSTIVNKDFMFKAKAKDLDFKAKAKDFCFVLEDTSRPR